MRRREFITLFGGATAWPLAARAQQNRGRIARIGIIDDSPIWNPFRQQLHELDHIEGQNVVFEYRQAEAIPERFDAAASALVQIPVDVIAVFGTPAAQAAQRATKSIPIVAIGIGDPIGAGLITSLARPGGNLTGNSRLSPNVATKQLQILKDAIPRVARITFLFNPDNGSSMVVLEQVRQAVPLFHMTLVPLQARSVDDFKQVFAQMSSDHPDALLTTNDPLHQAHIAAVIDFLSKNHIAGMFHSRQNVADGGLMSYGASVRDQFRRGALYVDKILRGTKPQDLPFEQPVPFELVVNLKTAKSLGIRFPTSILMLADEVID
jgi:putative tryptophan/tyrosine transport system substrate-binding protein